MAQYEELETFLEPDYHPDYWSDDVVLLASAMVKKFQAADWDKAKAAWQEKKSGWQARLADSMDSADPSRAFPLLCEMVQSRDDKVAKAAANSLRDIVNQGYPGKAGQACIDRLKELASQSRLLAMSLSDLIGKLEARLG